MVMGRCSKFVLAPLAYVWFKCLWLAMIVYFLYFVHLLSHEPMLWCFTTRMLVKRSCLCHQNFVNDVENFFCLKYPVNPPDRRLRPNYSMKKAS